MKKIFFLCLGLLISKVSFSQWSNWFNVSDQQYKIYIVSDDNLNVTQGYYLTNFPCYGQYNREYYRTIVGRNMITLFCLEPPKEIYLSYITKPIGAFVPKNAKADGYMLCPVSVQGSIAQGVIPRMQVNISECEKHEINPNANKDIIQEYDGVEL
ncbi:MAG: hypothetical protein K6F04_04200 [bacterium]|nr:hypothetical protein [bacterium]